MAEYLSRIRHDRHWQTVAATRVRFRSVRAGVGLDLIVYHWQIVLRGLRGSQVRCLELQFWRSSGKRPRTCPLLCPIPISRIMESHGIRFHQYAGDTQLYTEIRSPVPSQREALSTMCLGVEVLAPRQRALITLNQVRGHDPWLKAGSFQVGACRLVGYRRWSCGGQGRNQNPRCSSGSNLVNERPSEVVDEDLQLPHPCSPTCLPRSDFRIRRNDRPRSRHFSTRLL